MQTLPDSWVDALFARLSVRYGAKWLRMWEGIDLDAVKADWATELGGFSDRSGAIKYALDNLPAEFPPTAAQFKAIAVRVPYYVPPALPEPKADPKIVAQALSALTLGTSGNPKAWAYRLQEREKQGERLTQCQRGAWREALANVDDSLIAGDFSPVAQTALPPAMRAV